jgi:hypothetical protein
MLKPWPEPSPEQQHELGQLNPFPGSNLEVTLTRELWRLRRSLDGKEISWVYRDDFVDEVDSERLGIPALQLMACGTGFGHRRAAVVRQFFPTHTKQASFSGFAEELFDERQFYRAANFPALIQVRYVSPRALAQIARQL